MKSKIIIFISLLIFIVSSCNKEQDINLLYNNWEFEYFKKSGGFNKENPPNELQIMYVEFLENGTIPTVKGQTNACFGNTFKSDKDGSLEITLLVITLVCGTPEQLEWETRFFNALMSSEKYKITDNKLKIYYDNDDKKNIMVFKK